MNVANLDHEAPHTFSIQIFNEDDERLFNETMTLQPGESESNSSPSPVIDDRGSYRVTVTVDGAITKTQEVMVGYTVTSISVSTLCRDRVVRISISEVTA